jgi:DNA-binding transcriptional ArsR family regulator
MMRDFERERWDRDAPARAAALKEFGSKAAIFAETERERLLAKEFSDIRYDLGNEDAPPAAREAARRAFPMPDDLAGAWKEWRGWRALWQRRRLFDSRYDFPLGASTRCDCLEWMLDNWSDPTLTGIEARTLWLRFWETEGGGRGWGTDKALAALLLDIALMRMPTAAEDGAGKFCQSPATTAPAERRTNAQKRAAVLAMLKENPELSDGEISRRCGVSRQNVSNHRKVILGSLP